MATESYQDEAVLRALYWGQGWSTYQIGEHLDCSAKTIRRWMDKRGIPRREMSEALAGNTNGSAPRVEWATHYVDAAEYEVWAAWDPGDERQERVGVHQLLACLDNDPHDVFDPANVVHHCSGHSLDNRPSNVKVMTRSAHSTHHVNADIPECKHRVIQSAIIMEEGRA